MLVRVNRECGTQSFVVRSAKIVPKFVPFGRVRGTINNIMARNYYARQVRTGMGVGNSKSSKHSSVAGSSKGVNKGISKGSGGNKEGTNRNHGTSVYDVPAKMRRVLNRLNRTGSSWVSVVSLEDHSKYVKVGDKVFKEVPPSVVVQGSKVIVKPYIDVAKQYASMTNNGKVMILLSVGNFAFPNVWIDKDGKIYVPDYWKPYVKVGSDGSIQIDVEKLIKAFAPKFHGNSVNVEVSVRGKINGIVGGIAGTSTQVNLNNT